jgi:hypothetical protein
MTPASSDRYQSRLFRFVYQQSRRFTQQCDRAFRNLKSTASWVAAVGLYPLFLLLQSRRSTANQVHQAVEATLRQLPAEDKDTSEESPTVDTPIRQVLLYVAESQKSKVKSQNLLATSLTPYPLPLTPVAGIASQLSNRSLVLVTAQNQALDVLDPQQQESLQDKIISAIAAYWQYRQRQNQSRLPTPVRAGFESGSIALSEDLSLNPPLRLPTPSWLTSLDRDRLLSTPESGSYRLPRSRDTDGGKPQNPHDKNFLSNLGGDRLLFREERSRYYISCSNSSESKWISPSRR